LAAGAAVHPALSRFAQAQTYPSRPVRIIVGFPPGGAADITARLIGQWLSERLSQPFVIENRPGAGTNIATEAVVKAPADGYTLLLITVANTVNATLYEWLNFDFIRDIAPVAGLIRGPLVLELNPAVPADTISEFIAYAKANPGTMNMASAGNGTPGHMAAEPADLSRIHPGRQGSAVSCDDGSSIECIAAPTNSERIRTGIRGQLMVRHRATQRHVRRNSR
jgi:tripartite-type tricarboxylate transporter receptor subunit TctC